MDLSDVIAAFALAISLLTFASSQRAGGRAHLTVDWQRHDAIRVRNHGPGLARAVVIKPADKQTKGFEAAQLSALAALQATSVHYVTRLMQPEPRLRISWKDNRWRQQHVEVTLTARPSTPPLRRQDDLEAQVRAIAAEEADEAIDSREDMAAMRRRTRGNGP